MKSWKNLESTAGVDSIINASLENPQVIFKHSTTCPISAMALKRFEGGIANSKLDIHYLDLLKFREVSNYIASKLSVVHESPQALLLSNGKVVYHDSHLDISVDVINKALPA